MDEFRTYTTILLAAAPVLIDGRTSRSFLEQAQHLDGQMAPALRVPARNPDDAGRSATRLETAVRELRSASAPLLQNLSPEIRAAISGDDPVS